MAVKALGKWFGFLCFLCACIALGVFLFFGFHSWHQWNLYTLLDRQVEAKFDRALVVESDGDLKVRAHFHYVIDGKRFQGVHLFESHEFKDHLEGVRFAEGLQNSTMSVWTSQQKPHLSTFEKKFPLREGVYSLIAACIGIYFLVIRGFWKNVYSEKSDLRH